VGDTIKSGSFRWVVVGLFAADGSAYESEIWTDVADLQQQTKRNIYSSVFVRTADADAAGRYIETVKGDQRLKLEGKTETDRKEQPQRTVHFERAERRIRRRRRLVRQESEEWQREQSRQCSSNNERPQATDWTHPVKEKPENDRDLSHDHQNGHVVSIQGGGGRDYLSGGGGDDYVSGGATNDELYGDSGNDHLTGGDANDLLFGGPHNDRIYGDAGTDVLVGNAGDLLRLTPHGLQHGQLACHRAPLRLLVQRHLQRQRDPRVRRALIPFRVEHGIEAQVRPGLLRSSPRQQQAPPRHLLHELAR
jgi:Ca2+-binding RTX toxin-like protein